MSAPRLLSNRYELGDTLGYGGMSEVHHGHDIRLGREVAVKILRADLARDPQFQERFRREAQNAAALNHPAIVAVYDTGEADTEYGPLPYIVMEYVEGRTLRDIVKTEGPMPQRRAMEVMADVSAALDFSHRHGIIHRDVKPANVMITRAGAVKVMDFGIARAVHDGQAAMTQTAAVIGTAQYLSPEQARGEQVDARSDVYAAGCVLYELVTGEPPFTGDSPVAVAYQHVREDPAAPSSVNPAVSPELDAIVLKALAKGAANRYQSAAEMRSDLVRALSGQRPSAPMVLAPEERTQVLATGRRPEPDPYDDYPADAYADEEAEDARRRKRRRTAAVLAVLGLAAIAFVMWLAGVFDGEDSTIPVPDVVGQPEELAKQELRRAGFSNFKVEKVHCFTPVPGQQQPQCTKEQIGQVIGTNPQATETVEPSQAITLQVGVQPPKAKVPDLEGMTQENAERELQKANLRLGDVKEVTVEDPNQYGKVIEQNPGPNASIEQGKSVQITIGKEPKMVTVEDFTGRSFDEAKAALEGEGFEVIRNDVDSDQPEGTVVNQQPNGGQVPEGSEITLEVSNGALEEIQLPDLRGMTEQQARQVLQQAGHTGSVDVQTEEVSDDSDAGKVTNTNPPPGSTITKNQGIVLFIGEAEEGGRPTPPGDDDGGGLIPGT